MNLATKNGQPVPLPGVKRALSCPTAPAGRHRFRFQHNSHKRTESHGPLGSVMRLSLVGVYKCEHCEARKIGKADHSAPGNDLREQLK